MRYKVIFQMTSGTGNRASSAVEYYVLAEAREAANQWRQISNSFFAWVWDGTGWIEYAPIP